jgi:hypothetical protein
MDWGGRGFGMRVPAVAASGGAFGCDALLVLGGLRRAIETLLDSPQFSATDIRGRRKNSCQLEITAAERSPADYEAHCTDISRSFRTSTFLKVYWSVIHMSARGTLQIFHFACGAFIHNLFMASSVWPDGYLACRTLII